MGTVTNLFARAGQMAKRGHGEGSVYKRGKIWWISYRIGSTRNTESSGSTDKKVAQQLLRERLTEIGRGLGGQFLGHRFDQTATEWLDEIKARGEHSYSTLDGWERAINRHLIPAFGADYLRQLIEEPKIFDRYVTAKLTNTSKAGEPLPVAGDIPPAPLARSTVRMHLTVLSLIFEYAIATRRISYNPIKAVNKPGDDTEAPEPFDVEEAKAIRAQLTRDEDDFIALMMLSLGLRIGEVFGLQVRDWNSEKRELKIRRTVKRGPRQEWYLEELKTRTTGTRKPSTKTPAARRELIVGEYLAKRIDAQIAKMRKQGRITEGKLQLIVPNTKGGIKDLGNWRRRVWDKAVAAAGLYDETTMHPDEKPHPHRCRHTYASEQIAAGVSLPVIAYRMGHANARVTMTIYAHILRRQQREVADSAELYAAGPADTGEDLAEAA